MTPAQQAAQAIGRPWLANEIDAAIERDWPEKWAKANNPQRPGASKRRNNIRRAYRAAQEFKAWRAKHPTASCAGCAHARPYTDTAYPFTCDLEATGGWIAPVAASHVCMWWRKAVEGRR